MEYCWSRDALVEHKKELIKLLRTEKSKLVRKHIRSEISSISSLITDRNVFELIQYIDNLCLIQKKNYKMYKRLDEDIKQIILEAAMALKDLYIPDYEYEDETSIYSIDEVIELSREFYKNLPNKELIKEFDFYTNPENHLIQYGRDMGVSGLTSFFLYPSRKSYISICPSSIEEDVTTVNHEIAHAIYTKTDTLESINNNHNYLIELEGCLFNYLSIEYIKRIYGIEGAKSVYYTYMCAIYDALISLFVNYVVYSLYDEKKVLSFERIEDKINSYDLPISVNKKNIRSCLNQNFCSDFRLIYSYLTSLDIQAIYNDDPEKAFNIFESIRKNKTNDIMSNIKSNGITFMEDGYQHLRKDLKKFSSL